jgi:hypothetical protein
MVVPMPSRCWLILRSCGSVLRPFTWVSASWKLPMHRCSKSGSWHQRKAALLRLLP